MRSSAVAIAVLYVLLMGMFGSASAQSATSAPAQLSPEGPKFRFRMIGQTSPQMKQYVNIEKPYFGDGGIVEQRSHGRIKFTLASGAEMGIRDLDLARTLRSGVVDFSRVGMGSLAQDLPLAAGADLAGMYPDVTSAQRAMELFIPRLDKIVEQQQGMKFLGHYAFSGDVLYCRVPIKTVEDLKGKRVRTNGWSVVDLVDGLGGTNVTINFGEVYGALQQGVADCAVTDRASGNAQKWFEAAQYLYTLPMAMGPGAYAVNLKVWNTLPPDVQAFLQGIYAEVSGKQWDLARILAQVGTDCNTGKASNCPADLGVVASRPMTLVEPSKEDIARVKQVLGEIVIPRWLTRCGTSADECRTVFDETMGRVIGITLKK